MAICFYGGEPLLNMTFIEQIVELSKELNLAKQFDLEYTMTTNTTLLHKYMDFLVANNFRLLMRNAIAIERLKKTTKIRFKK